MYSPPVATEVYRQLLRQDFHLLERAAFPRRTTESARIVDVSSAVLLAATDRADVVLAISRAAEILQRERRKAEDPDFPGSSDFLRWFV